METDLAPAPLGGRPTTYSLALVTGICERIMDGESLSAICAEPERPAKFQILRWLGVHPEFRTLYRQARLLACELMSDELLAIADDARDDWIENAQGDPVFNKEAVARSRLRIETRQWLLARMLPRAYGARIEPPLLPAEPGAGEPTGVNGEGIVLARQLSPQQRSAVSRALAAKFQLEQEMQAND